MFDVVKRVALERFTAGQEGARHVGAQLTGFAEKNAQLLFEALLAKINEKPTVDTTDTPANGEVLTWDSSISKYRPSASAGGGAVSSVFTRTGAVVAASGDYNAGQITNTPAGNIAANTLQAAINELDSEKATPSQIPVVSSQAQADAGTDDASFMSPLKSANMLRISPTEVSVTGATTLTTSAFGKMHNCSGTTADYTVGLPTAVGNAGKIIAVRGDAGLTKVVTLDANSTETIGGSLTKAIVARQKTIIVSDGSNWYILHDYRLPPAVVSGGAWSQSQTITAGQINAFISTSPAISVTVPALGPAPEGYSWRIMLLGGTRWTTVGTGTPLLLLSFDGTGIHGGSLWPGNQTFLAWNALMTPATLTGSNTYTLQLFATVATSYTLVSGTLIAQPVLV